jgi:tetratricopeptide (TPR) repeat protein
MSSKPEPTKDFFLSYTGRDRTWAEWIAFTLEEAGYTTVIQAWDSRPGMNFVAMMNDATKQTERTIAVLSAAYLESEFGFAEWAAAFRRDPTGSQRRLVPVRIAACDVQGLLGPIVYVDLVGLDETQAKEQLLAGVKQGRAKPLHASFPGNASPQKSRRVLREPPVFPGSKTTRVENTGPVQGQNIGDGTTIHQYFGPVSTGAPLPAPVPAAPPQRIWNLPYPRNPFFTGRRDLLTQLAAMLHAGQPTALSQLQAISGLGGIGKTQIACEYAYEHEQDYQAVLWAQAETRENLIASFVGLARVLDLPAKEASESAQVVAAVKHWLQTTPGYLLILDNADDLALAREFLPVKQSGQVLLTTQAQVTGSFARRLDVEELPTKQGTLFLLRRAGLLAPNAAIEQAKESDRVVAQRLCEELGGLPLALDQAGAYIEETECGLAKYEQRYKRQRGKVLAERRGDLVKDHPLPVATTWNLSFEQVEQRSPMAADLLRVCAFLAPDAIPETIMTEGASQLGPHLAELGADADGLDEAVEVLRAYSLVRRDAEQETLSVHRLVQAVLRDQMGQEEQRQWAERVVRATNAAFPEVEHRTRLVCEKLLPHALIGASLIEQYDFIMPAATRLLRQAGYYLNERARYQEAELLLERVLVRDEQIQEPDHLAVAADLNHLALLYTRRGKYTEAEPLYERALKIYEQELGGMHSYTATNLNNLAGLYRVQGKYGEAERLYERALGIREQQLGAEHPDTAQSLNNLAGLYESQGKYAEAEPLLVRALAIHEQQLGAQHPSTAQSLNNLAALYESQGKYAEAEPLYMRALAIHEQQMGAQHPSTALSLNNLAQLYRVQGKYAEAEPLYMRALAICEQQLGAEHPDTAQSLNNLAVLYESQGKYGEAEPLYVRALGIREQQLGAQHPDTALSLNNLAGLYESQGKYGEAEPLYVRALGIREQQLGAQHPDTALSLNNLAGLYESQGKYAEAEPLFQRAFTIREQALGTSHPDTANSLWWLAVLSERQHRSQEAKPLYERALWIYERTLGGEHPTTQSIQQAYTALLERMREDQSSGS